MKGKEKILGLMVVILFVVTPWVSKPASAAKMYWTDSGTDKIQRADLDMAPAKLA